MSNKKTLAEYPTGKPVVPPDAFLLELARRSGIQIEKTIALVRKMFGATTPEVLLTDPEEEAGSS